jgi:diguanylate cyclase (GGDEF)-like protein
VRPTVEPEVASGRARRGGEADLAAVDALLWRLRWLAAGLTVVQFVLYSPPPGHDIPYSRWWGAVPTAMLVGVNVVGTLRRRSGVAPSNRWAVVQLVWDSATTVVLIGMFTFDDTSALWALLIIPVLEAATRGWRVRALATFGVLCVCYVVREVINAHAFPYNNVTPDSVTYRLGVLAIVAMSTAALAGRLTQQIASTATAQDEADQLRAVAVATRRMSSLDVPTVVREVTRAAEQFGFASVQLVSREGVVPGSDPVTLSAGVSPADWFHQVGVAAGPSGHAVLAGHEAGVDLQQDEVLVVANVSTDKSVEAFLVGRHLVPLHDQQVEGLTLLATQASAALANARRFEEGRAYEERLAFQATHDALTGLPNRSLLRDRAEAALARARRQGTLVALMFIDLDRFKDVNDVLGHGMGDALLQRVAERVVLHLRPEDTCARVGGDEFVVLAGDQPDEKAVLDLADRLHAAMQAPFHVDGMSLDIEASLGVAWAPTHGGGVDHLLRCADVAMYAAKTRRDGVMVYQESDDRLTTLHLATLGDLRRALDSHGQLWTQFQPIIDLTSSRLVGIEALLRWNHPSRGLVPPDEFIPVAEGTAVIHQITDHVLHLALAALHGWAEHGLDLRLSVNLSTRTLLDSSLSSRLESLLHTYGVSPDRLCLEITESTLLADPTRAIATMQRLSELGVRMSIDDFGTGYSSMSYLKSLPVDEIKIDRSFVTDMLGSARDEALVHSVVDLAHSLGLQVVAEGVEDEGTLQALGAIGCDLAQGFHLARPMPAGDLMPWLARREETPATR